MRHENSNMIASFIEVLWEILLIGAIAAIMLSMAFEARGDMITNTGAEMRAMFSDASRLTPEQLQILRDMQKDQLNAAKDLTQLDAERALQQSQVDADSSLARSVVTVAGALVVLLIVVLLITTRRQPATPNSSLYPDAPYIIQATRQREALPDVSVIVPDVYQAALPMQQSIVRRG